MKFRILGGVVVLAAALWCGWWFVGRAGHVAAIETWAEDRRRAGWDVSYEELGVAGFPNRFDTTLSEVTMADPASGVAWSAPFVQFLSLAYKPHQFQHMTNPLRLPQRQQHGQRAADRHHEQ